MGFPISLPMGLPRNVPMYRSSMFRNQFQPTSLVDVIGSADLYLHWLPLISLDENAMDKKVADTVNDHKRKHDDDDDDDDEGPSAGSNQGKSTKRRRTRESESAKNPSTTKESSMDKEPNVGSKTGKSAPAKVPVEEPTDEVIIDEQPTEDIPISDKGHVSDLEDTDNAHMPKVHAVNNWANAFAKAHQDPDENKLHNKIDDIGSFIRWYCRRIRKEELSKADLEGPSFMMVKGFHENNISLQFQMEECHKLLTNQIDLVNPEGHRIVPDINNPLPLGGPSAYDITHWWFNRKQFYINKHSEPLDRDAVRSHMRILSVISIKTYERYGYNYLREIVLRRADYNEYKISEKDFKSLHPNNFEDLNILHIQGKLDHLPKQDKVNLHNAVSLWTRNIVIRKRVEDLQLGVKSYQTKLNLEQPNWDVSDFLFKEDYTIVNKPREVIYRDRDDNKKMMRINEGMENRKWTKDDKRRSEDFIEDTLPILLSFTHCGNKSILRVLRIILVILPEHPSETKVFHNEDGNPARANIKQALGSYERSHKGVKASANSDIVYFFISAQDGDPLQDDVRICLGVDLRKLRSTIKDKSKDKSCYDT
ncbi:hypothetical protein Tco_0161785 [Tanacetum coccineum]